MKVFEFWLVTEPSVHSDLVDICFKTTLEGLALQYRGGLEPEEIMAMFAGPGAQYEAETLAKNLLRLSMEYYERVSDAVDGGSR